MAQQASLNLDLFGRNCTFGSEFFYFDDFFILLDSFLTN